MQKRNLGFDCDFYALPCFMPLDADGLMLNFNKAVKLQKMSSKIPSKTVEMLLFNIK